MVKSLPGVFARLMLVVAVCVPGAGVAQDVTLTPQGSFDASGAVTALDVSFDGRWIVVGDREGGLTVQEAEAGQAVEPETATYVQATDDEILFARFLVGDSAVVSVDRRGQVQIREFRKGALSRSSAASLQAGDRPEALALDAGRRYLAVATGDSEIAIFDLPTRQRVGVIDARGDIDDLLHLGFDRQGRQLLAVTRTGEVTAWNPATLESIRRVTLQSDELHGSQSVVHAVGADRSANILVVALEEVALPRGGLRGRARPGDLERRDHLLVFDWHSGAQIKGMAFPDGIIEELAVGPGNDHVVVANGSRVTLMDLRGGERGASVTAPAEVSRLVIGPEDDRLVVGGRDGQVGVWEMAYREPVAADEVDDAPPGLSGRLRVLGEDDPAITPDAPLTMAILPFDDRSEEGEGVQDDRLSRMVAELLTTQLANLEHVTLVERIRVDDLLDELELSAQGITEPHGLEMGRMLNADYILLGSIGAFGTSHTLSARLLDVETGEAVSGRQVLCEECRAQDFFDVVHLLGTTIAR
jgi:TolB-like protein